MFFSMAHAAIASSIISIPWTPKSWTWKLFSFLSSQITENQENVPKVGPERLPKFQKKSIKIKTDIWSSVCPLGVPLDPRITKIVSKGLKKELRGVQNRRCR